MDTYLLRLSVSRGTFKACANIGELIYSQQVLQFARSHGVREYFAATIYKVKTCNKIYKTKNKKSKTKIPKKQPGFSNNQKYNDYKYIHGLGLSRLRHELTMAILKYLITRQINLTLTMCSMGGVGALLK